MVEKCKLADIFGIAEIPCIAALIRLLISSEVNAKDNAKKCEKRVRYLCAYIFTFHKIFI